MEVVEIPEGLEAFLSSAGLLASASAVSGRGSQRIQCRGAPAHLWLKLDAQPDESTVATRVACEELHASLPFPAANFDT